MPIPRHVLRRIPGLLGLILVLTAALLPGLHALSHAHIGVEGGACASAHGHCDHAHEAEADAADPETEDEGPASASLEGPCSICQSLAATRDLAPDGDAPAPAPGVFAQVLAHGRRVDALLAQGCPHAAQARAPPTVS